MAFFNLQHTHRGSSSAPENKYSGLDIKSGEVRRIGSDFHTLSFTCRRGALRLTQEGDLEDHLLCAGSEITIQTPMGVVVQGLEDAVLEVARIN